MNRNWSKNHPFRAPDWRWLRANHYWSNSIKNQKETPQEGEIVIFDDDKFQNSPKIPKIPRLPDNDEEVLRILRFLVNRRAKISNSLHQQDAYELYQDESFCSVRWELESRILSNQTIEDISDRLGLSPSAIKCYENWFYDVRDKLHNKSYVFQCLINPKLPTTEEEPISKEAVWKIYAFIGDPNLLDQIIFDTTFAEPTENFWAEDLMTCLLRKLSVACRFGKIKPTELLREFSRAYKAKKAGSGSLTKSELSDYLQQAMGAIKWDWSEKAIETDEEEVYSINGASLRSEELAILDGQKPGPEFIKYLESAKFPDK